jgi:stringent starvation protein B
MSMTSNRPYLLRALNEWILDNQLTPYLLVDAEADGVIVPDQYTDNGKVVLNISPAAVKGINISNESIRFSARFGGVSYPINIPVDTVLAIYAKENGMGMIFPEETSDKDVSHEAETSPVKSHLKVIK